MSGQANAVLLGGDAGVGKSRLLAELVTISRSAGATVFTGRCLDVDEAGLPYLPFVEALGRLTESQRAVAAKWPVLRRLMPGLTPAEPVESTMEQLRLFDAVGGLLSELAEQQPALIAIEDLHWADASTRDLVLFLVSRLYKQRILFVGTYRVDDLHRRHPMRPMLGELSRLAGVDILELKPFDKVDAVAFVQALADGALPSETVSKIAERSEGNAFFCEELTAAYGDSAGVPSGLAELLLARVERLSANGRKVVRAASVASQTATHASLAAVSGLDDDVLEESLRQAVQLHVLVAADGGYTFRHALLREAVYGDLLPGERVRLHAAYAGVVTSQALLAYHSFRSHDLPGALAASVRAAEQAGKMGALGEKLRHVEQALELWNVVPQPEESGTTELALVKMAAMAAHATGEIDRAVDYARSAVALADELGDPEPQAYTRTQLALALLPLEDRTQDIQSIVEQAWDLVRDRPASVARARTLALHAREWVWLWDVDVDLAEMEGFAKLAIADARQVGEPAIEVDAMATLAVFAEWAGDVEDSIKLGLAASDRAAAIGAYDVELRARKNTSVVLWTHNRREEALRLMESISRRSAEVGLTWGLTGIDARMELVCMRYAICDWAGALAAGDDIAGASTVARCRVLAPTLWVLAAMGDFDRIDKLAAKLAQGTDDPLSHQIASIGLAEAAIWRGDPRAAVDHVHTMFGHMATLTRPSVTDTMMATAIGLWALSDIAAEARVRRDTAAVEAAVIEGETLADNATELVPQTSVGRKYSEENHAETAAFTARVAAELSRLRGQDDMRLWEAACSSTFGSEYWKANAGWRWASALLAAGDRDKAAEQALSAYSSAVSLGAAPLRDALTVLARRGRITLPGTTAEPTTFLTPRELAVLELVASGLTNKQVGDQLYISQKTASVHLSRVMAKLGATNRTEVVSIAYDRGLLSR
ncbi:DNA-binding CsgD family transcriptional regulator/tetratricopeptide (TPR) repeat protein [Kibdelosporangium banguiense]|uniref:DNA-binding CsgD family transcriptional regulator/tetratricopeptide (TPR) repeat protein n=1 Tax=Kibdelosporangium banguiense TaxID=1365924 RepID=A0ABS4T774_9PSEU|nr:DNA-binding CsgD family transcriptional regulator/tetratricopeptide (TPR) repeat protein [Kibdelosporangium banguiense]